MKKLLLSLGFIGCFALTVKAAPLVTESPVNGYGTPVTLAVSSTTFTKLPTTQTSGRVGVYVTNPSTRPVAGFFGDCTSTALATTIRPIQFALVTAGTGDANTQYFSMREDVCLWLIELQTDTASQNVHYQEIKQ